MSSRRAELSIPPDQAWKILQETFDGVGKIEKADEGARSLSGKIRYGLNPVRLRITVLSSPNLNASVLDIQGRGQDVWGVASRKAIDKLLEAFPASESGGESETKVCPRCAETIKEQALVCRYCGHEFADE